MRLLKSFFCSLLLVTLIFQSCSVEKRHYTNGYHLQWKHAVKPINTEEEKEAVAQVKQEEKVIKLKSISYQKTPLSENINALIASAEKKKRISISPDSIACDTLILRNETEIKVKVTEITPTEVKYKHCNNLNGPTYVVYRYEVSYIKYANGSLDSFVNEHAPAQKTNKDNSRFNPGGGAATEDYVRTRSLASLILGILSFFIPYIGLLMAVLAVIMGTKSMKIIRRDGGDLWFYSRRATAGLVLGWIVVSIYLLIILVALLLAFI